MLPFARSAICWAPSGRPRGVRKPPVPTFPLLSAPRSARPASLSPLAAERRRQTRGGRGLVATDAEPRALPVGDDEDVDAQRLERRRGLLRGRGLAGLRARRRHRLALQRVELEHVVLRPGGESGPLRRRATGRSAGGIASFSFSRKAAVTEGLPRAADELLERRLRSRGRLVQPEHAPAEERLDRLPLRLRRARPGWPSA